MSNCQRKNRKWLGNKFDFSKKIARAEEGATPLAERAWFTAFHPGLKGTKYHGRPVIVSLNKRLKAMHDRGILVDETKLIAEKEANALLGEKLDRVLA